MSENIGSSIPAWRTVQMARAWPRMAGWGLLIASAGVLLGWWFKVEYLTSLLPAWDAVDPFTAVALGLAGVALLMAGKHPAVSRTAMVIVGLVSLAHMVTESGGGKSELTRWLLPASWLVEPHFEPIQMGPHVGWSLLLCSLAFLGRKYETRGGIHPAQWLWIMAGAVPVMALIGHVYHVPALFTLGAPEAMGVCTALLLLVLCGGGACLDLESGLMVLLTSDTPGGMIARRLIPASLLVPLGFGVLWLWGETMGIFGSAAGMALFALTNMVVFGGLSWWIAQVLFLETQRAETALRDSEALYRSLVDTLPVSIIRKDRHGRFIFCNSHACRALNRTLGQVLGRTDYDLFPYELAQKYVEDDRKVLETRRVFE
ncbi:MAG TPA: PAS domain-containing protein, partial [Bacillota bacterium]|nr:PAS domain-containing protein [Bacillota bacterium]